jgi:hypothetical protein
MRGLDGVSAEDAQRRLGPMNCIAWNVGHLAWQEQRYWLFRGQGRLPLPQVDAAFAYGAPASTPLLEEVRAHWNAVTREADRWLDELTSASLAEVHYFDVGGGQTIGRTYGSMMLRTTYHYWYHTGENLAIRQMLGHTDLPEFVGNIDEDAPYRPEEVRIGAASASA